MSILHEGHDNFIQIACSVCQRSRFECIAHNFGIVMTQRLPDLSNVISNLTASLNTILFKDVV